ncbi:MAG: Fur family transcriptional regulator [Rhodobacteraceae bacterium]|nr:Fur family transcriptional regulator [Paracoccaceae bacterium]MAY48261.1 Fur family transcriptional regulator [Paracoccaceae bacterium]QEW19959.1 Zinc uptake regulation protein [Marinibacterium anthonyi]
MSTIGFHTHDHDRCITDTMATAEAQCAEDGLQFTPVRRRVLEILLAEHRAMGAYDILPTLAEEKLGSQPPVVYRALDFLVKNGLAHRIELLNAYIACAHLGKSHKPVFLICRSCRLVAEAEAELARGQLGDAAAGAGFTIERMVVEVEGLCPSCAA